MNPTPDAATSTVDEGSRARPADPRDRCLHELFEARADETPDAVALVHGGARVTYRALDERASRLAAHLRALGVARGARVAFALERSPEMVVAILAILKAGGAYVPLDPAYPRERLAFMLATARAPLLITQPSLRGVLASHHVPVLDLVADADAIAARASTRAPAGVTAGDVAYVMFTSGSTGEPRGVEALHRGVVRLVVGQRYARFGAGEVLVLLAPVSFDASTFELWGALLHGARCVLFPDRVPSPRRLGEVIRGHGITTLWLTASVFNAVVDEDAEALRGVAQILTGGEALSVPHVRRALEKLPGTTIINGYGPTEATTFACCHSVVSPPAAGARSIPIGRPIAHTTAFVLDDAGCVVPDGVTGELHLGGDGLARGYLDHPVLTAERFVPCPFGDEPGARLYRTGDLVRRLPDGALDFVGRADGQLKLRGFRIEPGEIEATLARHPGVRACAVTLAARAAGQEELVAHVVLAAEAPPSLAELRAFVAERLPAHLVPASFAVRDALPLSPTGKIDRAALRRLEPAEAPATERPSRPRDPLELRLVEIWEELLERDAVGRDDDFFALGGHSLLAARLLDRIEAAWGLRLPFASLHGASTVAALARAILTHDARRSAVLLQPIQPRGSQPPFIFVHGDFAGGGFYSRELARRLGDDQPFWVLEPLGRDGQPMPRTVEEIAARYVEALLAAHPRGPYRLGGHCNGGITAFEMARQLHARGERVETVVIIGVEANVTRLGPVYGLARAARRRLGLRADVPLAVLLLAWRWTEFEIRSLRGLVDPDNPPPPLDLVGRVTRVARGVRDAFADGPTPAPSLEERHRVLNELYFRIMVTYVPRRHDGHVTVLWPEQSPAEDPGDPTRGWGRVAAEVESHVIPGGHLTCLTRHGQALAEALAGAFARRAFAAPSTPSPPRR